MQTFPSDKGFQWKDYSSGCVALKQALRQAMKQDFKPVLEQADNSDQALMQPCGDSVYSTSIQAKTVGSIDKFRSVPGQQPYTVS